MGYKDQPQAYIRMKENGKKPNIIMGSYYPCPICGKSQNKENDSLFCCSRGIECYSCGCNIDDEDIIVNESGETYCNNCYRDRYSYCAHCDSEIYINDSTYINSIGYVCDNCLSNNYMSCCECGEYININNDSYITACDNEETYCDNCCSRYLSYCEYCEKYYKKECICEHIEEEEEILRLQPLP